MSRKRTDQHNRTAAGLGCADLRVADV